MPKPEADPKIGADGVLATTATEQLKSFSQRAINLLQERDDLNEDIKSVFDEARDAGFDTKIMRKAIKEIRTDADKLQAERSMVELYVHAIQGELFEKGEAPTKKKAA